ncbi:MAG: dephospho-CoA kinase [Candidatus Aminicenantes bacterium]|nr:dephospho-CoA kinase [Candidatus Aminicenantes bacterium]
MTCSRSYPSRRRPSPKRRNRVLRVALTGGIACGKSVVARILAEKGCAVYSADEAAHRLTLPGRPAWARVIARFGRSILRADGTIDRAALGRIVFSDPEARRALEGIVHPLVLADREKTARRLERQGRARVFVVEAALTIEAGYAGHFDRVVVVHCRQADQIKRLRERDGISRAAALRKIGAQMPMKEKLKHADYAIDASGSLAGTVEQAERLHAQLVQDAQLKAGQT